MCLLLFVEDYSMRKLDLGVYFSLYILQPFVVECVVLFCSICKGSIKSLLPILYYVFLSFSREFAEFVSEKGYALAGKNDLRFVEGGFFYACLL